MINGIKAQSIEGHTPLPKELYIKESPIHGMGLFAKQDIPAKQELGISHVADERFPNGYIRTPLGGFVNHSYEPNIEMYEDGDTIHMRTIRPISKDQEITVDYTPYYSKETLATYK